MGGKGEELFLKVFAFYLVFAMLVAAWGVSTPDFREYIGNISSPMPEWNPKSDAWTGWITNGVDFVGFLVEWLYAGGVKVASILALAFVMSAFVDSSMGGMPIFSFINAILVTFLVVGGITVVKIG